MTHYVATHFEKIAHFEFFFSKFVDLVQDWCTLNKFFKVHNCSKCFVTLLRGYLDWIYQYYLFSKSSCFQIIFYYFIRESKEPYYIFEGSSSVVSACSDARPRQLNPERGRTEYKKVRLNVAQLSVSITDQRFTIQRGPNAIP